jgi:hypothetical protein
MKNLGVFVIVFIILSIIFYIEVQYDITVHPWVMNATIKEWKFYNYFTSGHSPTVLFVLHTWIWFTVIAILSLAATFSVNSKSGSKKKIITSE